ncbi:MAG TPA: hypothetical protein VLM79_05310 [Kofleriaceae bacterium]|nr:hypothetical protein [Kofleriaceae bacterium]
MSLALHHLLRCSLIFAMAASACTPSPAAAIASPGVPTARAAGAPADRDGQHDFDFEIGTWKTHLRRLQQPLTGSQSWVELDGTSVIRKVWDGRANLVELDVSGPSGHIVGLSLRLYNPETRTWSLNFASASTGTLSVPTIGRFADGRGEFFDHEEIGGRQVLVRNVFSEITDASYRFEQAFSADEGKSWEINWIAIDTRVHDAR